MKRRKISDLKGLYLKTNFFWAGFSGASEGRGSFEDEGIQNGESETDADLYIKDAILVFRALCKLSKKSIQSEW